MGTSGPLPEIELTATQLAEYKGWNRIRAQRLLRRVERLHPGIVERRGPGRTMVVLASKIAPFITDKLELPIEKLVRLLATRCEEMERRLDGQALHLSDFQKKTLEMFKRIESLEKKVSKSV